MPSLNKKSHKSTKQRSIYAQGKRASAFLKANSSKKFVKQYGTSNKYDANWQYGHLNSDQALSGSDKLLLRKEANRKSLLYKIDDIDDDDNISYASDVSDIDTISQPNAKAFLRRDRKRARKLKNTDGLDDLTLENEKNDEDDELVSSGDDLNYDSSGNERYESEAQDVDTEMKAVKYERRETRERNERGERKDKRKELSWGTEADEYYGADGKKDTRDRRDRRDRRDGRHGEQNEMNEMRDEESIAMEQQRNELAKSSVNDYFDAEMLQMMAHEKDDDMEDMEDMDDKGKESDAKEIRKESKESKEMKESKEESNESNENKEKIVKRVKLKSNDEMMILKRDHPELIGILKELANVMKELKEIEKYRLSAIEKQIDDVVEDFTLFLDLNRTYASILIFYLHLKACGKTKVYKGLEQVLDRMVLLKKKVCDFRKIYDKSVALYKFLLSSLSLDNGCTIDECNKRRLWYRKMLMDKERERNEKEKANAILNKKKNKNKNNLSPEKLAQLQKRDKMEQKLLHYNLSKMENWDLRNSNDSKDSTGKKKDDDLSRRQITQDIFKSKGLHRYRTQGIPRVKKRIKWEKKQKAWKKKGYKPYTGKKELSQARFNINVNNTHSVQFR